MTTRTVVDGIAGHLLHGRRCGASKLSTLLLSRSTHGTSYAATRPGTSTLLPDEVIDVKPIVAAAAPEQVKQTTSEDAAAAAHGTRFASYWAPDPATGVFAPDDEHSANVASPPATGVAAGDVPSVLEQTAWIRELEVEEAERPHPNK